VVPGRGVVAVVDAVAVVVVVAAAVVGALDENAATSEKTAALLGQNDGRPLLTDFTLLKY